MLKNTITPTELKDLFKFNRVSISELLPTKSTFKDGVVTVMVWQYDDFAVFTFNESCLETGSWDRDGKGIRVMGKCDGESIRVYIRFYPFNSKELKIV